MEIQTTPINLAATIGSAECLKELLAARDNKQDYEVTAANATGDTDFVKEYTLASTDSNVKQPGLEPLISAVRTGKAELVEELLKYGADVNATDKYGNTVLMTSVRIGNKPVFQLLIDWGAEINAENDEGETALYLAVTQSHVEYQRMQSEEDENQQKHISHEAFSLEGSSQMVYTLLRGGAHLHETTSGLNPCSVHLNSTKINNPKPYSIERCWMLVHPWETLKSFPLLISYRSVHRISSEST